MLADAFFAQLSQHCSMLCSSNKRRSTLFCRTFSPISLMEKKNFEDISIKTPDSLGFNFYQTRAILIIFVWTNHLYYHPTPPLSTFRSTTFSALYFYFSELVFYSYLSYLFIAALFLSFACCTPLFLYSPPSLCVFLFVYVFTYTFLILF